MKKKVAERGPKNRRELKKIILEEWEKLELETIKGCISHIQRNMKWIAENNGEFCRKK